MVTSATPSIEDIRFEEVELGRNPSEPKSPFDSGRQDFLSTGMSVTGTSKGIVKRNIINHSCKHLRSNFVKTKKPFIFFLLNLQILFAFLLYPEHFVRTNFERNFKNIITRGRLTHFNLWKFFLETLIWQFLDQPLFKVSRLGYLILSNYDVIILRGWFISVEFGKLI